MIRTTLRWLRGIARWTTAAALAATLTGSAALHAQTEVQVGGLWAQDVAQGISTGVLHDKLLGTPGVDTTWVDMGGGQTMPVETVRARTWTLTTFAGLALVDGPLGRDLELALHGQLGFTRRFPNAVVDRLGVLGDALPLQGAYGASAAARLKAAFWIHAGAVRRKGRWEPLVGLRLPQSVLEELGRFLARG